ncbi:MAG: GHKL domain-containing protein, partial [Lachnospiraceae bacterium]|nr:GHKL domain-containing protein [Lachnospiraceae bacterium]
TNTMMIEGQLFLSWWDYAFAAVIKLLVSLGLLMYRKHFQYEIQIKDAVLIGAVSFIFYMVCFSIGNGFFTGNKEWYDVTSATGTMLFSLCFPLLLLFYKNNTYLKKQNQAVNRQVQEAQMHYQYYLEKEKQEEKVRSIYHDMKNHLLILESGQMPDATCQMTERLRNEISGYESYIQSGNRFLDIILGDKAQKAKDGKVDFSAFVDFSEITFIDPLDISTIFGNGIDNALEACEKLPLEKRIVVVKGCKKEKFVLILIENNYAENGDVGKLMTNKEDAFWHGFGIPNIERAVQKYEGECKIVKKNGRFTLTIIIPFPSGRYI